MSFKGAIRAYLFSNAALTAEVSESGTNAVELTAGAIIEITVSGLSAAPASTGQVLLKNAAGNYELVNYTAVVADGADYDFTVSATIANTYAIGDYTAIGIGVYTYPAPQAASLPYCMLDRISTDEVLNKLDGPATVLMESWQVSVYAATDDKAESIKDDAVAALNLVNPTTWSNDGFINYYVVDTSIFVTSTTVPDLDLDGSQDAIIHKPLTFTIKRSIATTPTGD